MKPYFIIAADPKRRIIQVEMGGFFGLEDIDWFIAARHAAHGELRSNPGDHLTLVDIRDMKIQSGESVDAFKRILADPRYQSRRIAFVIEPGLARQQIRRAATGRGAGFFADPAEAMQWLTSAQPDPGSNRAPPAAAAMPWHGGGGVDQASTAASVGASAG